MALWSFSFLFLCRQDFYLLKRANVLFGLMSSIFTVRNSPSSATQRPQVCGEVTVRRLLSSIVQIRVNVRSFKIRDEILRNDIALTDRAFKKIFKNECTLYLACNDKKAFYHFYRPYRLLSCQNVCDALSYLLDNIYIRFSYFIQTNCWYSEL